MMKEIYIALVDDWELRGTGAGSVEELQVKPMNALMDLFEKYGIKNTFNVEVMQQIKMRQFQDNFPNLKKEADLWDEAVLTALRRGHDVQLHIHPQWYNAIYTNIEEGWKLSENWDITKYPRNDVENMFEQCLRYLNDLFEKNDIVHRICAYRAGSWAFAPSDFMIDVLKKYNIALDMSLVKGLKYDTKHVTLDYTYLEEELRPFYPVITDARKISDKKEAVICVPTFRYKPVLIWILLERIKEIFKKNNNSKSKSYKKNVENQYNEWERKDSNILMHIVDKFKELVKISVADLSNLSKGRMKSLKRSIYLASKKDTEQNLALILENHTKDISSFNNIEFFISEMRKDMRCHFITISEMVKMIENNQLKVVMKNGK